MASDGSCAALQDDHSWLLDDHPPLGGKYKVERVLGQGGMGIVLEARHVRVGQRVAIKVLGSALRAYPELVQRFEREARACGALSSRHAVRVFDIDATEDGTPFIVMELLAGRDLSSIVEQDGPQPVPLAVGWIIEACDAIAEAHRLGIIHRDLKPSNLFLTDVDGHKIVKVLDFGIAKRVSTKEAAITQAVAPLGTPQYMSPEQVRCAKDIDGRTDVWSLGVTLYEMLCGQTPFAHESASASIAAIIADPPPDPRLLRSDLPDELAAVLLRALEKNAKDRYQSVEDLVAALAPFAATDDDTMVSAVRRAFLLTPEPGRSRVPTLVATVGAAPEAPAPVSESTIRAVAARARPAPRRRLRSPLGLGAALLAGLLTVAVVHDFGATTVADAATVTAMKPAAASSAATPEPPPAPAPAPAAAPAPEEIALAPSAPPPPRVLRARVEARIEKPAKDPSPARSGVHGGLSNPGF